MTVYRLVTLTSDTYDVCSGVVLRGDAWLSMSTLINPLLVPAAFVWAQNSKLRQEAY